MTGGGGGADKLFLWGAVIYYPFMHPPQAWIKHALLYWDRVYTVVPVDYPGDLDDLLHPDVLWLRDQGIYEPPSADSLSSHQVEVVSNEIITCLAAAEGTSARLTPSTGPRRSESASTSAICWQMSWRGLRRGKHKWNLSQSPTPERSGIDIGAPKPPKCWRSAWDDNPSHEIGGALDVSPDLGTIQRKLASKNA